MGQVCRRPGRGRRGRAARPDAGVREHAGSRQQAGGRWPEAGGGRTRGGAVGAAERVRPHAQALHLAAPQELQQGDAARALGGAGAPHHGPQLLGGGGGGGPLQRAAAQLGQEVLQGGGWVGGGGMGVCVGGCVGRWGVGCVCVWQGRVAPPPIRRQSAARWCAQQQAWAESLLLARQCRAGGRTPDGIRHQAPGAAIPPPGWRRAPPPPALGCCGGRSPACP
jgi:hypothetical protein